ncbi:MAG: ribosomal RNA small subunit methyltransferase A [Spirochaetales bacterium]|jgi:16S rRNA (adenine1518-N6/adenine1519-N6)-dimethyltransferase|nr:ribosomal RNA small subunit methyltransferase A [Spirochaetales bacterium]
MSKTIKTILSNLQTPVKKNFGQHFLINKHKIDFIADKLLDYKNDIIIEIGPGLGSITERILESTSNIVCIEKDRVFSAYLRDKFGSKKRFAIINQDVLKVNFNEINRLQDKMVFGNLPYNIASQIIIKFVDELHDKKTVGIFMFQKEVAERILSKPGLKSYNAFTLKIQSFFDVKNILNLNENDFWPPPKIKSTLIMFTPKQADRYIVDNYAEFSQFLATCFKAKRKTLINNLQDLYPKEKILSAIEIIATRQDIRAEKLREEEFVKLFKYLYRYR